MFSIVFYLLYGQQRFTQNNQNDQDDLANSNKDAIFSNSFLELGTEEFLDQENPNHPEITLDKNNSFLFLANTKKCHLFNSSIQHIGNFVWLLLKNDLHKNFMKYKFIEVTKNLPSNEIPYNNCKMHDFNQIFYTFNKKWHHIYCCIFQFILEESKSNKFEHSAIEFSQIFASKIGQLLLQVYRNKIQIIKMESTLSSLKTVNENILHVTNKHKKNSGNFVQKHWTFIIESCHPELFQYYIEESQNCKHVQDKKNMIEVPYDTPFVKIIEVNLKTKEKSWATRDPYFLINSDFAQIVVDATTNENSLPLNDGSKWKKKLKSQLLLGHEIIFYPDATDIQDLFNFQATLQQRMALITKWVEIENLKKKILNHLKLIYDYFIQCLDNSQMSSFKKLLKTFKLQIKNIKMADLNQFHVEYYENSFQELLQLVEIEKINFNDE